MPADSCTIADDVAHDFRRKLESEGFMVDERMEGSLMNVRFQVLDASGQVAGVQDLYDVSRQQIADYEARIWDQCYWATEVQTLPLSDQEARP